MIPNLIIGAGPAGIATAASLKKRGLPYQILESSDGVASSWKNHYERLHLHTCKALSALPYLPFPEDYGKYPARQEMVDYFEAYARHHDLEIHLNQRVQSCTYHRENKRDAHWLIETQSQSYRAKNLIVATGYNQIPHRPQWEGMAHFEGKIMHAKAYRNGEKFAGQRVLVVGMGNSGGEIAIDLWEWGAKVSVAVRSPTHVMPRDFLGRSGQESAVFFQNWPTALQDYVGTRISQYLYGDIAHYGLTRPDFGPATQLKTYKRVPLIDIGTMTLIKQGALTVYPGLKSFQPGGVTFVDGQEAAFDAVILATGYRPGVQALLHGAPVEFDGRGVPQHHRGKSAAPHLYFVGFDNPTTGFLREIGRVAQSIAEDLAINRV